MIHDHKAVIVPIRNDQAFPIHDVDVVILINLRRTGAVSALLRVYNCDHDASFASCFIHAGCLITSRL